MELSNKTLSLTCVDLSSTGEGVCDHNGFKIFVEGVLPGEEIECRLIETKRNYGKGKLIRITKPSVDRQVPNCPYFGECGGCQIMHLKIDAQLRLKKKRIEEAFFRIGRFQDVEVESIEPSQLALGYRNKIQMPLSRDGVIGMYKKRTHEIVDIETCDLHEERGDRLFGKLRKIIGKTSGVRHILIRSSKKEQKSLVLLVGNQKINSGLIKICHELGQLEEVATVVYGINNGQGNYVLPREVATIVGPGYLVEEILGIDVRLSATSFFQVNHFQAEKMYEAALEWGEIANGMHVVDAYSGVGVLSCLLAKRGAKVTAIEVVNQAVLDSRQNAHENGLKIEAKLGKVETIIQSIDFAEVVYLNPPRKGCEEIVLETVAKMNPSRVIYTSCDPATLARDAKILVDYGYRVSKIKAFDLFPQTMHVETICLFVKI